MYIEFSDFCLRNINGFDAESYLALYSHPEVARFDDYTPISREDLAGEMKRIEGYHDNSAFLELAVASRYDNKMMGVITLDSKRKYCYLGYHFHPDFQGKGYAVRSVMGLLENMDETRRQTMRLVSHPENKASISLAEKVGFVYVGRRKLKGVPEVVYRFDSIQWASRRMQTLRSIRVSTCGV